MWSCVQTCFLISKVLTRYFATSILSNFIKYKKLSILVSERKSWYLLEILLYNLVLHLHTFYIHTRNDIHLQQYFLRTPSIPSPRYSRFSNVQFQFYEVHVVFLIEIELISRDAFSQWHSNVVFGFIIMQTMYRSEFDYS